MPNIVLQMQRVAVLTIVLLTMTACAASSNQPPTFVPTVNSLPTRTITLPTLSPRAVNTSTVSPVPPVASVTVLLSPTMTLSSTSGVSEQLDNQALSSQIYQQVKDGAAIVEEPALLLPLPDDIQPGQIKKHFRVGTVSIGLVLQPSMNVVLDLPNGFTPSFTGLVISEAGSPWRKYLQIQDATYSDKNNPYYLWSQDGQVYLSIVDQRGAGSGEGLMKLARLSAVGNWDITDCYYYGSAYRDEASDGDYLSFSQRLDKQKKEPATSCQNVTIRALP